MWCDIAHISLSPKYKTRWVHSSLLWILKPCLDILNITEGHPIAVLNNCCFTAMPYVVWSSELRCNDTFHSSIIIDDVNGSTPFFRCLISNVKWIPTICKPMLTHLVPRFGNCCKCRLQISDSFVYSLCFPGNLSLLCTLGKKCWKITIYFIYFRKRSGDPGQCKSRREALVHCINM